MTAQRVVVDVGANHGLFCIPVAERNPEVTVVAVEPNPVLASELRDTAEARGLTNLAVVEVAISGEHGAATLHVSSTGDAGVSSLLDFDREHIQGDRYWRLREDLNFDGDIDVEVITLDMLLERLGDVDVRFIKVDAQGLDADVLASAPRNHHRIAAGMLEVSMSTRTRLYVGARDGIGHAAATLQKMGFRIDEVMPNDPACNEANMYFDSERCGRREVESELSLAGIGIYEGTDFWEELRKAPEREREFSAALEAAGLEVTLLNSRLTEALDSGDQLGADFLVLQKQLSSLRLRVIEAETRGRIAVVRSAELERILQVFQESSFNQSSGASGGTPPGAGIE